MATPEDIKAAEDKRDDMVVVDDVRYRPKDAAKLQSEDKADDGEAKARTAAANKARTADGNK